MITLIVIACIASVVQIYFWLIQLDMLARSTDIQKDHNEYPTVSLIVAAKDELLQLKANIDHWLNQDYLELEVVIVNDHSRDGSLSYLLSIGHKNLRVIDLPDGLTSKKIALSYAIARVTSKWIVTTDADCQPNGQSWITAMMGHAIGHDVIIGYSPHRYISGRLARWIDYETWYIAVQYLSAALMGRPYMSVGRNVAFKKEVFDLVGGYLGHQHIKSGDDDLLINDLRGQASYGVCIDPKAWVWTEAKRTVRSYIQQKRRHLTTAPHYHWSNQVWLVTTYTSQLIWYVSVIGLIWLNPIFLVLVIFRYLMITYVVVRSRRKITLSVPVWRIPFFDFFGCLIYGCFGLGMIVVEDKW